MVIEEGMTVKTYWSDETFRLRRIIMTQKGKVKKVKVRLLEFENSASERNVFTQSEEDFKAAVRKHTFIIKDQ